MCDGALCERLTAVGPADHTHLAHALVQPQQSCTSLETPSPPLLVQLKQGSARLFSAASNSSHNSIITLALLGARRRTLRTQAGVQITHTWLHHQAERAEVDPFMGPSPQGRGGNRDRQPCPTAGVTNTEISCLLREKSLEFLGTIIPPISECGQHASASCRHVISGPSARHKSGDVDCSPRGAQPPRCPRQLRARPVVWRCSAVLVDLSRGRRCIGDGRAR